ncbi:MAG: ABC transporter permease [Firmicutes bacterium]|nr:ABC transporter permease [Bacillota bacterium]
MGRDLDQRPAERGANATGQLSKEAERYYAASQWQLMWWRFRRHRAARIAGVVLIVMYCMALFAGFLAPYSPTQRHTRYAFAPPQRLRWIDNEGKFHWRPFVYGLKSTRDPNTFELRFSTDHSQMYPIYFIVRGSSYRLLGFWESDLHLFGASDPKAPLFLFGTDRLGRDLLSRVIYGAQISLSIGLVGVFISYLLGLMLGGISGYYGGTVDTVIQRIIEMIQVFPTIPLWLALSAAIPSNWSQIKVYFAIVVILSFVGWTSLARVVRGKLLSLRDEGFVTAARLAGGSDAYLIRRHLLPSFTSHIIVAITLSIPGMILGETSLSFLGLGLQAPAISWGVLLREAQNVQTVAMHPWLMIPVVFVIVVVLSFNFLGDGLRDAADPYA